MFRQNFALTVAEAQLNKKIIDDKRSPTKLGDVFDSFDMFFLVCFALELAINLTANWLRYSPEEQAAPVPSFCTNSLGMNPNMQSFGELHITLL